MRLLVTSGTGYVGSVVAAQLLAAGHQVTVIDDLSTGHEEAVPPGAAFVRGTVRDKAASVLTERRIEAVLHFAASSQVGESVANPAKYWSNNLGGAVSQHRIYNLGSEAGYSVREVIDVCQEVTGQHIPVTAGPRRPGDPAILVASAGRIKSDLGWQPRRDLNAMVIDAWQATGLNFSRVQE